MTKQKCLDEISVDLSSFSLKPFETFLRIIKVLFGNLLPLVLWQNFFDCKLLRTILNVFLQINKFRYIRKINYQQKLQILIFSEFSLKNQKIILARIFQLKVHLTIFCI